MFRAIDISYSGLSAYKQALEVTANNITNINTTRTDAGGPYKRQAVVLESKSSFDDFLQKEMGNGVQIKKIVQDGSTKTIYNPEHPDADNEGNVRMPSVQLAAEMTNMMQFQKGYEMSASVLNATKEIMKKESEIGRN